MAFVSIFTGIGSGCHGGGARGGEVSKTADGLRVGAGSAYGARNVERPLRPQAVKGQKQTDPLISGASEICGPVSPTARICCPAASTSAAHSAAEIPPLSPRAAARAREMDKVTSTGMLVDLRHPFLSARQSVARMVDASLTLLHSQDGILNLGGSIETIYNPVSVVEIAIEKGAAAILMPIGSRRQLNDLPDDLAAIITTHDYLDAKAALVK
jgi:hypothetical protein